MHENKSKAFACIFEKRKRILEIWNFRSNQEMSEVAWKGYLWKKGGKTYTVWRVRWVVITNYRVFYYYAESKIPVKKIPRTLAPLGGFI